VHVELAGVLFILWGVMTTLVGTSTLALAVGAVSLMASATGGAGGQFAAGLTAGAFTALGAIAVIWGVSHVLVGALIRKQRPWPWARHVALTLSSIDLVLLPYGTALGCYVLWTLLREDGKRIFQTP
jgi:hypothetical protein